MGASEKITHTHTRCVQRVHTPERTVSEPALISKFTHTHTHTWRNSEARVLFRQATFPTLWRLGLNVKVSGTAPLPPPPPRLPLASRKVKNNKKIRLINGTRMRNTTAYKGPRAS